jgi:chorismate dehydratase
MAPPLSIGSVPYANALPLTCGLPEVRVAVPSALASRFRAGEFDVALLPTFEALRQGERPIVPAGAIVSRGPVDSVLLFSRRPLAEAKSVLLDRSSLTSAALTRVLFAERIGARPVFSEAAPDLDPRRVEADALLLIGDPAMRAPRDGLIVSDLAVLWREWTSLPFCFAVWVARDEATARRAEPVLREALARGRGAIPALAREASIATGLSESVLRTYLSERITYDFGPEERRAVARFGELCRKTGLLAGDPAV